MLCVNQVSQVGCAPQFFLVHPLEPKKAGRVIKLLNLTWWQLHGGTHPNLTYLCCVTSDKEMPPEKERIHFRD